MAFLLAVVLVLVTGCPSVAAGNEVLLDERFESENWCGRWRIVEAGWSRHDSLGRTSRGSVAIGATSSGGRLESIETISVGPGEFLLVRCWARTREATGETRVSLVWLKGDEIVSRTLGGSPHGEVVWRPNPISGTVGWSVLMARGFVPSGANRVRVVLESSGNSGSVWFDDVTLERLPRERVLGEVDLRPAKRNPASLKPGDYVTIKNGHLHFKGKRLWIWSGQWGMDSSLTHADIDRELARFVDHGFNGWRCLWWEREVSQDYVPGDCSVWDRRDYLVAALGRKGVFFWCDLLNSCRISPDKVGVIDDLTTADSWANAVKQMAGDRGYVLINECLPAVWDERCRRIYFDYMRRCINHRNPYNGLTYGEDPTIFCWELTNEEWWIMRMLWGNHLRLPEFFQRSLYDKWNSWLRDKYDTETKLRSAWGGLLDGESLNKKTVMLLPLLGEAKVTDMARALGLNVHGERLSYKPSDFSKARAADVVEFLVKLHVDYKNDCAREFRSLGRKGLGSQIVPLVYDTGYSGAVLPLYGQYFGDATAVGVYADMRSYDPSEPTFPFVSGLNKPPNLHGWLNNRRVAGKPAFVYENMTFNPQKYRAEWIYRLLAWLAIQDYDVVDFHYYGHPLPLPDIPNSHPSHALQYVVPGYEWNGTVMRQDEVMMSAVRVAAETFKQGYLKPAPNPTVVTLGRDTLWSLDGIYGGPFADSSESTVFVNGFRWAFDVNQKRDSVKGKLITQEELSRMPVVKPTNQIAYRWKQGIMVIDDGRVKALAGFVPRNYSFSGGLTVSGIHVNTPKAMPFQIEGERYVCLGIVSADGRELSKSARALISAVNTSFNHGFSMDLAKMASDTDYAFGLARSITNRGDLPVVVGRVGLTLQAPWLMGRRYRMLDFNGRVLAEGRIGASGLVIPSDRPIYVIELLRG
jgi:hypothetical protein